MRLSFKLYGAFIGLTCVVLVLTLLLARWSFQLGFLDFINGMERERLTQFSDQLIQHYEANDNSWNSLRGLNINDLFLEPRTTFSIPGGAPPPRGLAPPKGKRGGPRERGERPRSSKKAKRNPPTGLYDINNERITGPPKLDSGDYLSFPLFKNGQQIGELRSAPAPLLQSNIVTHFSQQQTVTSVAIGTFCLLFAMLIALLLTRRLLKPIKLVQASVNNLATGNYGEQITHTRADELGMLIDNVNMLSHTLEQNRSTKNRWFANISHELRTPLTVLSGEIEAMLEGIRPLSKQTLSSLDTEVRLLRHLVDDLYTLSITDLGGMRYSFQQYDIVDCIKGAIDSMQNTAVAAGLRIETDLPTTLIWSIDCSRIEQLLFNLISNSIKYTDPPGVIEVSLKQVNTSIELTIEDSSPSCTPEECELLFEPLYRNDQARTRGNESSSAGLGLAIVRNIVEAHNGKVSASPANLGGIKITILLQ